jgi:hypothetical protein
MMPKAWYSMIEEREIRVSKPCCIPRLNRRTATFGDGISTSTSTSRTKNHGSAMLGEGSAEGPDHKASYSQDGHAERVPELLLAKNVEAIGVPLVCGHVVAVRENDEDPGEDETRPGEPSVSIEAVASMMNAVSPADEAVMTLEDTKPMSGLASRNAKCGCNVLVVCVSYPGESASDRAEHEKVRDNADDQDCVVVVLVVDKNVNNTEDKPQASRTDVPGQRRRINGKSMHVRGASRVNASQMLQSRCAAKTEGEGSPLQRIRSVP